MRGLGVSRELLAVHARRGLAGQFMWLCAGLLGPQLIALWTILHPFDLRQAYHRLAQCAIWLSGWYVAFSVLYVLNVWLRSPRKDSDGDLRHLPLSELHFLLRRWIDLAQLPLTIDVLGILRSVTHDFGVRHRRRPPTFE